MSEEKEPDAWYLLKFVQRVLESPSPTEADRLTALGMTRELRDWAWRSNYRLSDSPVRKNHPLPKRPEDTP